MKTYLEFLSEKQNKTAVIVFGRMNPPTIGHKKLLDVAEKYAKKVNGDFYIFLTKSQDNKKNPLTFNEKREILLFGYSKNTVKSGDYSTIFDVLVNLYKDGYKNIALVAGSDRVKEFESLINKYNGKEARHGMYSFNNIEVISAGERDPDKDDVSGVSATKVREYAINDDYDSFKKNLMFGDKLPDKKIKEIMNKIKERLK